MTDTNLRIGVFGTWRGASYVDIFNKIDGVTVTAVCDNSEWALNNVRPVLKEHTKIFTNFDDFLDSGLFDALMLCNYFTEHTPFAIRAMERGIHILSECTPAITMAECVALCRTVEKTGCKYMLAENYPYFPCNLEMKRRYDAGDLGRALYCEGEYNHPGDANTYNGLAPGRLHWRNWIPRSYYLTHSLAPVLAITGNELKSVNCKCVFDANEMKGTASQVGDMVAVLLCEMQDGSLARVTGCGGWGGHGNWYRICGTRGSMENVRGSLDAIRIQYNGWQIPEGQSEVQTVPVKWYEDDAMNDLANGAGHGGGDYWCAYHFVKYVKEGIEPPFDVYRSVSMSAAAILGMRSALEGGKEYAIPNFRDEEARKVWENDNDCPFPDEQGRATMPCCSHPDYKPTESDYAAAEAYWKEHGLV